MHNIAIGIISITIALGIIYVLGRITIIIADCIQMKQQHQTQPIHQIILLAAKKRPAAFDHVLQIGSISLMWSTMAAGALYLLGAAQCY